MDVKKEFFYFNKSKPNKFYVSRSFPSLRKYQGVITEKKRFIRKKIERDNSFELVKVDGELLLQEKKLENYQVNVVVYSNEEQDFMEFTIQKFYKDKEFLDMLRGASFSFTKDQFSVLLKFLSDLNFIDLSNKDKFTLLDSQVPNDKIFLALNHNEENEIIVDKNLEELIKELLNLESDSREQLLERLKGNVFSKQDLDILSGRKEGLERFEELLFSEEIATESDWQKFFYENSWIFGYGLDYRFLSIIQKEASVSSLDLDSKNEVKSDFLLGSTNFTVLVELKRPDTALFSENKNRSESWKLSMELTYAVSQILAQKAEWELNAENKKFDNGGNPIEQISVDPKTILVIGESSQFSGNNKTDLIKKKTFELYRRNMRNIEILTYDELHERARFIVG